MAQRPRLIHARLLSTGVTSLLFEIAVCGRGGSLPTESPRACLDIPDPVKGTGRAGSGPGEWHQGISHKTCKRVPYAHVFGRQRALPENPIKRLCAPWVVTGETCKSPAGQAGQPVRSGVGGFTAARTNKRLRTRAIAASRTPPAKVAATTALDKTHTRSQSW